MRMTRHRSRVAFLLIVLGAGCARPAADDSTVPIARWFTEKPIVKADGSLAFVPAPAWLREERAASSTVGSPERWWRVDMRGPFDERALCQHCGAIAELARPIPAGQAFRVTLRARSVSGARILKVLRRWGGFTRPYWGGTRLAEDWQTVSIVGCAPRNETRFVNFSVRDAERPQLGPCAPGVFCLADVVVEMVNER